MRILIVFICVFGILGCKESYVIKPSGEVRLEYPQHQYKTLNTDCPYSFEYSVFSREKENKKPCLLILNYPEMRANIHLTYFPVDGREDLSEKIKDSEKFVQQQTAKASFISPQEFLFEENDVYGTLFELGGDSALNLQFHATDSTRNILTGSVYFTTEPNYDSLRPAIKYLKEDVVHLIETLRWK